MKHLLIAGAALRTLTACGGSGAEESATDKIAKISQTIETNNDPEALNKAEAELTTIINAATAARNKAIAAKNKTTAAKNKTIGSAFLTKNAATEGVKTTDSGLQYKVVQAGLENGAQAEVGQEIAAHYHGYFIDGEIFDSSYRRGQPLIGPSNGFIKGWNESLGEMKVCEARTLYINSDLAYGDNGRGGIPAGATLLFNMQLLAVKGAGDEIYECPEDKVLAGPEAY